MTHRHGKEGYNMIKKFYSINNGIKEGDCFSVDGIYFRLIVNCIPTSKAECIRELVSTMQPGDFLVFNDCKAGRIEIRCWTYYND